MKKVISVLLLIMGWVIVAQAEDAVLSKPNVLGEENIFLTEKLSARYDTIIVKNFPSAGAEITNMDKDEQARLKEVKPDITRILTTSLVENLKEKTKFARVSTGKGAGGRAVIVEGKFTRFNAGHGAAKIFLGWMAPESAKTNIAVSGRLVDARTGKTLATFSDTRSGSEGSAIGFVGEVFKIQAKDEGEEIAKFIEKLY